MKNKLAILLAIGLLSMNLANGQNQWVTQNSGTSAFLTSVYFVSADTGYVCSEAGTFFKTTNGGTNWNYVGHGPNYSLVFLNAQKGFGAGEECILKTANGGTTWDTAFKNPAVSWPIGINFPNSNTGFAAAWDQDMGSYVLKSSNSGTTWDTIYHNSNDLFNCIFFLNSQKGFVGGWSGYIYKTENGGNTWVPIPIDTANGIVEIYSIHFPTPDTGFAASDIFGVYRTIDGGNTWDHLPFSFPPALYTIWFTDANHGFVGGGDGLTSMTLYRTSNGGNTWTQSASGVQTLNGMFFVDSLPGYSVGTNGTILKYTHTSGIGDNSLSKASIDMYPNPATNDLTIETPQKAIIEIVNLQGQLIKTNSTEGIKTSVDVSDLPGGVYFIKLTNAEGSVVRKFVKE